MRTPVRFALLALTALAVATPALAQAPVSAPSPTPPVHRFGWVVEGTVEYGGEVLVTLLFDDGSEQEIRAGQGATAAFGFDYRPLRAPQLGLRATAGVKFTTNASENSDVSFLRFPIEAVGSYYLPNNWRVGAGLAYHTGVSFNGDGFAPDVDFDPALGATLELGWKVLALSYTAIDYKANGGSIGANSFGLSASWVFGKRN